MNRKIHVLKTWPKFYRLNVDGLKTFEFRKNDRDFKVHDILVLKEYDPTTKKYSGRMHSFNVTYMVQGSQGCVNLPDDMCIMAIRSIEQEDRENE